ncbi:MAG: hypothetical protein J6A59_03960 [Lachnospiraceae bacterium]|nr:hypothetical protein [Lachnospiraceae bacterium]
MKRYHECAIVKDGNKRVGYFYTDMNGASVLKDKDLKPWIYADANKFTQLVAANQVQYLTLGPNNSIICKYTEEEVQSLSRHPSISKGFIEETQSNYFDMDASFKYQHVNIAMNNPNYIAGCVGEVTSLLGIKVVLLYFVGNQDSLLRFCEEIKYHSPNLSNMIQFGGTCVRFICPLDLIESLCNISSVKPLFSVSTLKYYTNKDIKTPKIAILQKRPNKELLNAVIKKFESMTRSYTNTTKEY